MASESTQETRIRDHVFISYSHKDIKWMEKFRAQLSVIQQTVLEIWSDERIESGQNWLEEINAAIARARVALLLVTPDFFASEFIRDHELPKILTRHQGKGLFLSWVPIRHTAYQKSYLAKIQAAISDPGRPLRDRSEAEQDLAMSQIAGMIGEKLAQSVRVSGDERQRLMENVRERLKGRFEVLEEVGYGDTSIVFRGRQGLRDCAVKVMVSGKLSPGERKNLKELLGKAA